MDCTIFKYLLYSIKKQKHYRHNLQPPERTLKIDPVGQFREAASLTRWQPTKITFNGNANQYISYLYNATGQKIQKTIKNQDSLSTTHYINGFPYFDHVLQFFPTPEGYVKNTPTMSGGYSFDYVYNYLDHLGNIRLSYTQDPQTGILAILEENHYYPFGLRHANYNSDLIKIDREEALKTLKEAAPPTVPLQNPGYMYKYNGKEYQEEFGLNSYDYGARLYMPDLGRWSNPDALSDLYPDWSPYNYTLNNPIFYIDPDGNYVDSSFIYEKNDEGNYKNQNLVKAFETFATSKEGIAFLSNYAEEGQVIAGVEYGKSGEFHNNGVDLGFGQLDKNDHAEGRTAYEESDRGIDITINVREKGNADNYIKSIGHEGYLHADKYSVDYSDDKQINFSTGIDKDIVKYVESLTNKQKAKERFNHHFQERRDKVLEKKLVPILQSYYQSKGIKIPVDDVKKGVNGFLD